jgi:hypothetical protein
MRVSPSLLDNLSFCPCFQYKPYEEGSGGAADEGVLLHKALETGEDDDLNAEQTRTLEKTREFCQAQLTAFLDWDNTPMAERIEIHEQKLTGTHGLRGLMDRCYSSLKTRKALIVDLKTGRLGLIREAADSLQLAAYADMLWVRYPGLLDEIKVALVSPRTNEVSAHVYRYDEWDSIIERISAVIASADHPFKQPSFHEVLCAKCNWFSACPAASKAIVPVVSQGAAVELSILTKPVEELTIEELAQNRAASDLFGAWAELRKKAVDERTMTEGLDLPGYTKVKKDGSPFVPAEQTASAWELVKDLLTPEQFIVACGKPNLGKLVEQLADDCLGEDLAERKAKAREELFDRLEPVIQQSKGSSYLRRRAKLDLKLLGG